MGNNAGFRGSLIFESNGLGYLHTKKKLCSSFVSANCIQNSEFKKNKSWHLVTGLM